MRIKQGEIVGGLCFALMLGFFLWLASTVGGCGSNIPIDGAGGAGGGQDVCSAEGVEDCCPECDERSAYRRGFNAGQISCGEWCVANPPPCQDDDSDTDRAHGGHK